MKPVRADFKPLRSPPKLLWVALGILLISTLATLVNVAWGFIALRQERTSRAPNAVLAQEVKSLSVAPERTFAASEREMLRQGRMPWPLALTALESTAMEGIVVRKIEANASDATIRVEVTASSHAMLIEYLGLLNNGDERTPTDLKWTLQRAEAEPAQNLVRAGLLARASVRLDDDK